MAKNAAAKSFAAQATVQEPHPPHILVVDDSRAIRTFMEENLGKAGYTVHCAENGREALKVLAKRHVDMVISDIDMPVLNGKAFRAKMLEEPEYATLPFLVMSTQDTEENVKIMRELRVSAFLSKPFKADQMIILVERILDYTNLLISAQQEMANQEKVMLLSSIMSLAQALDARDAYTRSHSDSVAETATRIARHMACGATMVETAHIAGRLHDIGKVGIPDSVLQKPGKLTEDEFNIIKTHPGIGARILEPIPSLFEVATIIHAHHEKYDGSGYPRGLTGEQIPFLARVLALADAYDALTSDRPYRQGMGKQQALAIIKKGRGSHFCPTCLDAFLESI
ncbi:MAG: response regulator [Humidesulfovibrio sp.]|uniref:HD domain-containing phosphohydrolase n=1 Tax=Humidesulfovibrio sp. TaxID=2910988 RepID=UPI0027FBA52E|nr:HD domain-containing phosphohydrolase [Humidesulfovibrio sp.]MDQ7834719.1 response regulator [Humidesulfovibrio sp.]